MGDADHPRTRPNEAYDIGHLPAREHDLPPDWTVFCNGIPVHHCAPDRKGLAERYATDPGYRPTQSRRSCTTDHKAAGGLISKHCGSCAVDGERSPPSRQTPKQSQKSLQATAQAWGAHVSFRPALDNNTRDQYFFRVRSAISPSASLRCALN
jgi:hypothetical protein